MKKIILSLIMVLILNIGAVSAHAALTEILPTIWSGEESLTGTGNILDTLYTSQGLQLVRIDDSVDQWWTFLGTSATVTAKVKYAGYDQEFGYFNSGFNPLIAVTDNGYVNDSGAFSATVVDDIFNLGDNSIGSVGTEDPVNYLWSSLVSANDDNSDHMVTWQIIDPTSNLNENRYVVAFEDGNNLRDRDFNDLVVEVIGVEPTNPVPEPMTMLLLGPALLGLVGLKKKRS